MIDAAAIADEMLSNNCETKKIVVPLTTLELLITNNSTKRQSKTTIELLALLENSLANWEIDRLQGLEQFSLAVNRYKDMLFAHIGLEEREIIPLARKHLLEEDWQKISLAFSINGDPRFDEMVEAKYKKLFSEIINRADMRI